MSCPRASQQGAGEGQAVSTLAQLGPGTAPLPSPLPQKPSLRRGAEAERGGATPWPRGPLCVTPAPRIHWASRYCTPTVCQPTASPAQETRHVTATLTGSVTREQAGSRRKKNGKAHPGALASQDGCDQAPQPRWLQGQRLVGSVWRRFKSRCRRGHTCATGRPLLAFSSFCPRLHAASMCVSPHAPLMRTPDPGRRATLIQPHFILAG